MPVFLHEIDAHQIPLWSISCSKKFFASEASRRSSQETRRKKNSPQEENFAVLEVQDVRLEVLQPTARPAHPTALPPHPTALSARPIKFTKLSANIPHSTTTPTHTIELSLNHTLYERTATAQAQFSSKNKDLEALTTSRKIQDYIVDSADGETVQLSARWLIG